MMFITPPIASVPYSELIGPRMTSTRSIAFASRTKLWILPCEPNPVNALSLETGRLSIKTLVYFESMPRILMSLLPFIELNLGAEYTPGTSFTTSATSLWFFFSISSLLITEIVAGASLIFCSKPHRANDGNFF